MMKGGVTNVVYVLKRHAKVAKTALEQKDMIHKSFRMVAADTDATQSSLRRNDTAAMSHHKIKDCIAIPVDDAFEISHIVNDATLSEIVVASGAQLCPFSTGVLGNRANVSNSTKGGKLSLVHQTILDMLLTTTQDEESASSSSDSQTKRREALTAQLQGFDSSVCPNKLEIFGDDRTVVLPPSAFDDAAFHAFLCANQQQDLASRLQQLWQQICKTHRSKRIVRRGPIDAESRIRHSGHTLVWPIVNAVAAASQTGPDTPGWICVTEQGIRQSFDLTRVMFSRGNISEKIRFGRLVRHGDEVLDMYAGIGYYTLPAIIHGHANHVTACEWNDDAVFALKYNVTANMIADKVTVRQGDCRVVARQHSLVNRFDRVSLGLLPSSEGGWVTAVRSLKTECGGWLHVHANVPEKESRVWLHWLCRSLVRIAEELGRPSTWVSACNHMERVKSFAPTISHYVADVFVGPMGHAPTALQQKQELCAHADVATRAFVLRNDEWSECGPVSKPPSCALSESGVLCQRWMSKEQHDLHE